MHPLNLKSDLGVTDIIGHGILWIILTFITLGLAVFVFPYYMQRFIISKTYVLDGHGRRVGRLECTIDFASILGNTILWALISIVTLGLGYFIFVYKINAHCMNHTKVIDLNL